MKLKVITLAWALMQILSIHTMETCLETQGNDEISKDAWILAWQEDAKKDNPGFVDPQRATQIQKALETIRSSHTELRNIAISRELKIVLKFSKEDVEKNLPLEIKKLMETYKGEKTYECKLNGGKVEHYAFKPCINIIGLIMNINEENDVARLNPIWRDLKTMIQLEEKTGDPIWKFDFIENIGKTVSLYNWKGEKIKSNEVDTEKRITHTVYYNSLNNSIQRITKQETQIQ